MVPVVIKWQAGSPVRLIPGQFIVYESGEYQLIGSHTALTSTQKIIKHTTLIEGHELEWLQSMATKRHLGDSK